MFCPNCQAELADQAKFCTKCGASLAATPIMSTPTMQDTAAPESGAAENQASGFMGSLTPKKKGILAGVGSAIAVAIVAIVAVSVIAPGGALAVDENNFPDDTFRAYVSDKIDTDHDGKLSKKERDAVTSINISSKAKDAAKVKDLTGIGHFHGLKSLNASHNHLHCLPQDFHDCRYIRYVDLSYNQINQNLDFSHNTNITVIYIDGNENDGQDVNVDIPEGTQVVTDHEASEDPNYKEQFPEPESSSEDSDEAKTEDESEGASTTTGGDSEEEESADSSESAAKSSSDKLFAAQKEGKWGYVDEAGAVAIDFEYADAGSFSGGMAAVKSGSDYSVIKRDGSQVKDVSGKQILPYSEGVAYVASSSGSGGSGLASGTMVEAPGKFVDESGKDLGVSGLTGGGEFHAGYAPAKTSSGWGFVSKSGSWAVNAQYSQVTSVASVNGSPVAGVCQNGTWTYIDVSTGKQAFDGEFSEASAFDSTGHAVVRHSASSSNGASKASATPDSFVTTNGRYVPEGSQAAVIDFDDEDDLDAELYEDEDDEAYEEDDLDEDYEDGDLDSDLEEDDVDAVDDSDDLEEESEEEEEESEKDDVVTDKYVVIDGSGNDTGVIEQSTVTQMYEGLAAVSSGGSWGFVGTDGSLKIGCNFKGVGRFSNGFAPAQDGNGKWGIISTSGSWVVDPTYDAMQSLGAL